MRIFALGLAITLGLAAGLHSAGATPAPPSLASVASAPRVILVAHHCGKGRHWIAAGYARGGKYRAGHCAPK